METLHPVKMEGVTELALKRRDGSAIIVSLVQAKIGDSYPYKDALLWGGDVGQLPKTILTAISVQDRREKITVPLSAYSDLGDVKSASVQGLAQGFTVSVHGGDTAGAYDALLRFSHGRISERIVSSREFPDQAVERTHYSFP